MVDLTPFRHVKQIDSTNTECSRLARAGRDTPLWILADEQTHGRGRLNRPWQGGAANLYASGLYQFNQPPARLAELGFAAGLAVIETLAQWVPAEQLRLKWPNDVMLDGAKLAGILPESGGADGQYWLVTGFGINLGQAPDVPSRKTACLAEVIWGASAVPKPIEILPELIVAFEGWIERWQAQGFEPVRRAWLANAFRLGQTITTSDGRTGIFEDLRKNGALVLRKADGQAIEISAGEVFFSE
ncbi:MAG: biotin--[acetyl-CoA-carboxylase] ligase [Robiginitomaculum sp.]|nr:MAG: biotin--[acetyl-CoA-carboxylase] ligase [Robiginitomaculum sp.]